MIVQRAEQIRFVLELALVVVLAVVLARLVWLVVAPADAVSKFEPRAMPTPLAMGSNTGLTFDRTVLVEVNPFGDDAPAPVLEIEAPETNLNLRLIGFNASTDRRLSSAQITTPDNRTRSYREGDEVLPGVKLARILTGRVILNREGETESLLLNDRLPGRAVLTDDSQVIVLDEGSGEALSNDSEAGLPVARGNDRVPAQRRQADRGSAPSAYRITDPDAMLRRVRLEPLQNAGRIYAYRVSAVSSETDLKAMGFESGDELVRVNGRSVQDVSLPRLITAIGDQRLVELVVERKEEPVTLVLEFEE